MKIGKLPEPMLIRSVLREVGHRREEILEDLFMNGKKTL